jgi:hypothetical protein
VISGGRGAPRCGCLGAGDSLDCRQELGLEDGAKLRVDTTVVQTDIHHPTDNTLLWDVVRVVTRLVRRLAKALELRRIKGFCDRTRAARRRMYEIQRMTTRQRHEQQARTYRVLIDIAEEVVGNARAGLERTRAPVEVFLTCDRSGVAHQFKIVHEIYGCTKRSNEVKDRPAGTTAPQPHQAGCTPDDKSDTDIPNRRRTRRTRNHQGETLRLQLGRGNCVRFCVRSSECLRALAFRKIAMIDPYSTAQREEEFSLCQASHGAFYAFIKTAPPQSTKSSLSVIQ